MFYGESKPNCNTCTQKRSYEWSWLPAFFVAILPKCHFCVMAYAGAVSLCSGNKIYPNSGSSSIYITVGLAVIVLAGILMNYKGKRTWFSALIALCGVYFLAVSQLWWMSMTLYYFGVAILFFGIWYNGSFAYFQRKLSSFIYKVFFRTKSYVNDDSRTV